MCIITVLLIFVGILYGNKDINIKINIFSKFILKDD